MMRSDNREERKKRDEKSSLTHGPMSLARSGISHSRAQRRSRTFRAQSVSTSPTRHSTSRSLASPSIRPSVIGRELALDRTPFVEVLAVSFPPAGTIWCSRPILIRVAQRSLTAKTSRSRRTIRPSPYLWSKPPTLHSCTTPSLPSRAAPSSHRSVQQAARLIRVLFHSAETIR